MTCDLCDQYQNGERESGDGEGGMTFYRVDKANVMIVGCNKHVATVMKTLNRYYDKHGSLAESLEGEIR